MNPLEMENARDRVHSLRARLSDTTGLLEDIARNSPHQDNETLTNMRIAVRAIRAVIDDLETVCSEQLKTAQPARRGAAGDFSRRSQP
jgi:CHAD domain-containing protein